MLTPYINEAMSRAKYRILEDGTYFGGIPELIGVWSNEVTLEQCRKVLQEVLEEWLLLKLRDNEEIAAGDPQTDRNQGRRLGEGVTFLRQLDTWRFICPRN